MGKEILTYDDLLQIVELIKSAEAFSEFHLKIGDIELDLRKSRPGASNSSPVAASPAAAEAVKVDNAPRVQNDFPEPAPYVTELPKDIPAWSVVIKSPMVGTFYRSSEPGAKPFVEVGQQVSPDTTVCIIEVMKLMNSLPAGSAGRVTHVLVNDAQPVEMGQALIVIDPKG
ncbi:MAG TPA: acetyl-CoA carboxylase biotin carboxyl carrier protein [Casimicrobiaceae bacterium]|nr:acetyl-CoA carboxylase biotin carboxyl carrier protein [Casimicrobiaceae bacterium]